MAIAPNTGSTLTLGNDVLGGGKNKTSTSLSTNIIIKVNDTAVGAIQQLSINENRAVREIYEVGTDGAIDSTPTSSTKYNGSCQRIRFDRLRISEAFLRGFLHVKSQVYPFDIYIIDRQKKDSSNWITTVIKNVWITSLSYGYQANDWILTDTMNWLAEDISSYTGGNLPAANGGERGLTYFVDDLVSGGIERQADIGANGRRGSMDVSGIIDLTGNLF